MTPLFKKLNLCDQERILVLNAPSSFEPELDALDPIEVIRESKRIMFISFAIFFVTKFTEVTSASKLLQKFKDDPVIWFAYPKASSKNYTCEFNRETGWAAVGDAGFEAVRQVAIDADWSALRFRRTEFIKTLSRDKSRAVSAEGRSRSIRTKKKR